MATWVKWMLIKQRTWIKFSAPKKKSPRRRVMSVDLWFLWQEIKDFPQTHRPASWAYKTLHIAMNNKRGKTLEVTVWPPHVCWVCHVLPHSPIWVHRVLGRIGRREETDYTISHLWKWFTLNIPWLLMVIWQQEKQNLSSLIFGINTQWWTWKYIVKAKGSNTCCRGWNRLDPSEVAPLVSVALLE